jgi:hypothetical protein
MAYSKTSWRILGVGLSAGLFVGGIASIAAGIWPLTGALISLSVIILLSIRFSN